MNEQLPQTDDEKLRAVQIDDEQLQAEATRAAESQINPDLTDHPDVVVDKDKAVEMAYASKNEEEQVVEHAKNAMAAMSRANTSDIDFYDSKRERDIREEQERKEREASMSREQLSRERDVRREEAKRSPFKVRETPDIYRHLAKTEAEAEIDKANQMRVNADQKAKEAGELYDSVHERTSELMSGKQLPDEESEQQTKESTAA